MQLMLCERSRESRSGEIVVVVIVVVVIVSSLGKEDTHRDRRGEGDRASPDGVMISKSMHQLHSSIQNNY